MDTPCSERSPRGSTRKVATPEGIPVTLSDGRRRYLAEPTFRAQAPTLTTPDVDFALDAIFDDLVVRRSASLRDVWSAARTLLLANYDLDDDQVAELLRIEEGGEQSARMLAGSVVEALLGSDAHANSYTAWVRASLLANGLGETEIPARDLPSVLAVLVATQRTIPLTEFADACRCAQESSQLETLL